LEYEKEKLVFAKQKKKDKVKEQVEPVILDKSTTKEEKERFDIE
jgi:hypothetical protein